MRTEILSFGAWGSVELLLEPDFGASHRLATMRSPELALVRATVEALAENGSILSEGCFVALAQEPLWMVRCGRLRLVGFYRTVRAFVVSACVPVNCWSTSSQLFAEISLVSVVLTQGEMIDVFQ